jgi:tellurite resistance protein
MKNRQFLDGLIAASVAVAEETQDMKLADMQQQTWETICKIQARLLRLAAAEAERLENT